MRKIRRGVFETNSSSTHSITIIGESTESDTLPIDADGAVVLTGGNFGWEWTRFNDALTKANYCVVHAYGKPDLEQMLKNAIQKETGTAYVVSTCTDDDMTPNYGYIDHQSVGTATEAFADEETLRRFIFDKKSWLFTGNDNVEAPANLFDVNREYNYTWELSLDGTKEKSLFEKKPDDNTLRTELYRLWDHRDREDVWSSLDPFWLIDDKTSFHLNEGYLEVIDYDYIWNSKTGKNRRKIKARRKLQFLLETLARPTFFDRLMEEDQ